MTARWERRAGRLAWGIGLCSLGLVVVSLVLLALDWKAIDSLDTSQVVYFLSAPVVGILGVLIAARRPRNPIGWLLLAIAVANAMYLLADFLAMRGLLTGASPRSWVEWPAWVFNITGQLGVSFPFFVILFFPDGQLLPGPRWRRATRVVLAAITVVIAQPMIALAPTQLSPRLPSVPNPLAVPALDGLTNGTSLLPQLSFLVLIVLVLTAVVVRFRRSRDLERHQMRWFAYVGALTLAVILLSFTFTPPNHQLVEGSVFLLVGIGATAGVALVRRRRNRQLRAVRWSAYLTAAMLGVVSLSYSFTSPSNGNGVANAALAIGFGLLLPATIGLAIMRHGLYDIDVFISRTLVYGSLAVFITAVYVGIAVGIGALVGSGGKPNLGLSILATAIVAVGFQPVSERLQRVANRLVYGKRATPYEVLSQFSERVAESYASEDVLPRMARVLQEGTGAESATVWLRASEELRPAASFPDLVAAQQSVPMRNGTLPAFPGATRSVAVRHQGEVLGALTVSKRRGEALSPIEQKLVDDLAHQAGLVLKNVGLTADLQARLVDLRASRQRLVAAQDDERRRLERNLHDGAQQHLVALKVKLGLAEMLLGRDEQRAYATLGQLKDDADEALETLRDLARGIYPPLLADKGLPTALQAQARKATLPVTIEAEGVGRYSQDTEAALYFCILEALQNIQKYAQATSAVVRLREDGDQLSVQVSDDGRGFDVAATSRGNGLTNMEDRLDALGGTLHIASTPEHGTTLRAAVPVRHTVPITI
jgi:signal transduction histidine kinase